MTDKTGITDKEKEVIRRLNDPFYNVELVEKIYREGAAIPTKYNDGLKYFAALGYLSAVRAMVRLEEAGDA
jgi:hypothetical protein